MITATVVYYSPAAYGPAQHMAGKKVFFSDNEIRSAVRNAASVLSRSGASHIVMDRDSGIAFQVSGYNAHRGAFVDVLPLDEIRPYIVPVPGSVSPFCAVLEVK